MIRRAIELDIFRLGVLADKYAKEDESHLSLPYDREHMMMNFASALQDTSHNILVSVQGNEIVGFIWGTVTCLPWTPAKLGLDNIFYVLPEYRGRHGVLLIRAYEEWCIQEGAGQISISVASGINVERTCKLFKRMGFKPTGYQYRKEVQ